MKKTLFSLLVAGIGFVMIGCSGGGDDAKDQPKVSGKVEQVAPPTGENVDDSLKRAQQQRDAQAAQNNAGQNDANATEGGH